MPVGFCGEAVRQGGECKWVLHCRLQVVDLIRALVKAQHGGSAPGAALSRPAEAAAWVPAQQKTQHSAHAGCRDSALGRPAEAGSLVAGDLHCMPTALQPGAAAQQEGLQTQSRQIFNTSSTAEMRRLARERATLVATGIYGADDALIQQLDVRMGRLCAEQLQQ